MPKLLDYAAFCEDLPQVKSTKIMDKKKFHSEGLFSEQIFGPLRNYTCQCNIYHGLSQAGSTCPECKVDIVSSNERRRRFAKIVLPFPVVNPIFYDLLKKLGGNYLKSSLDLLMKNEKTILLKEEDEYRIINNPDDIPEGTEKFEKLDAIQELVQGIAQSLSDIPEWKLVLDNIDKLFIKEVIVLPPDLRPAAKGVERNSQVVDKINRFYMQILTIKEIMKDTIIEVQRKKEIFYSYYKQLQKHVNELYDHVLSKLAKKEGLIRGNILGKRTDFSGRAVIVPEPTLNLDECVLPYLMFLELFKLQIAKRLIDFGKFYLLNNAIDYVDTCIEMKNPILFEICEELAKNEVCLLNRQPSLHRLSMMGFKIKVSLDKVIKIHPLCCPGFNADFDGDQMAVYIPLGDEAKTEVKEKFLLTKNFNNPANEGLTTTPNQDIILGLYTLTTNSFPDLSNIISYKGQDVPECIKLFNECLPEDYPLVNEPIKKKVLLEILDSIKNNYSYEILSNTLDKIKMLGFKYSTLYGASMSLDECYMENYKEVRDQIYENENIGDQLVKVSSKETENLLKNNFSYSYMVESGARGSWEQVRQIVLTRGFISNFKGEIIPVPIKQNLLDGLDQQEFFNSTYGCRKGLLDVALNTGASGYLSRKLLFTCANMQLDYNLEDCGTTDYLEVFVDTKQKAKMLVNRYYLDENKNLSKITKENYLDFLSKIIYIRSPIYCKNQKICKTCYGDSYKNLDSQYIGIIAAQSLGECNTQLILRVFHTSGIAKIKDNENSDLKQKDIVADLSVASNLLHNYKGNDVRELVNDLFNVYNRSRDIYHVHIECVAAQLMWSRFRKWRLIEKRDQVPYEFVSVQGAASRESWLLGLAFSNPKNHILKGIIYSGEYKGIIDKILCGECLD